MELFVLLFMIILVRILVYFFGLDLRAVLSFYLLVLIIFLLSFTVAEMPPFGDPANPVFNEVPARYLEEGPAETGAVNVTAAVILDYRAFDTLGEATVLFTAVAAVVATMGAGSRRGQKDG